MTEQIEKHKIEDDKKVSSTLIKKSKDSKSDKIPWYLKLLYTSPLFRNSLIELVCPHAGEGN